MRIAILWDWNTPTEDIMNTWDGPLATYNEIAKQTPTRLFTGHDSGFCTEFMKDRLLVIQTKGLRREIDEFKPDYIFCWGSFDRPWHKDVHDWYPGIPKGLRFSGGDKLHPASAYFDTIFCESSFDLVEFAKHGIKNTRLASACDTNTFKPYSYHSKKFTAVYPTSFCGHKRIHVFADTFGENGIVCGRPNEPEIVTACKSRGVHVLPRVPSETLAHLYNMSDYAVCTAGAYGGGARMVLEAMACNTLPVVMADNETIIPYVREADFGIIADPISLKALYDLKPQIKTNGRDYVLANFTPEKYAQAIMEEACKEPVRG